MEKHLKELEAYNDCQDFAINCVLGNLETGRAQPELVCEAACREARRYGIECQELPRDISLPDAMNFVAELIARVEPRRAVIEGIEATTSELKKWTHLNAKPFLTPPEVSQLLCVSPDKVALWIDDPVDPLPAMNTADLNGKKPRWNISREELNKWLARRTTMSGRGQ